MTRPGNISLLKIHSFLTGMLFFAPIMAIYFADVAGSYALGMSVFAASSLSSAIFELPTGIWSDRAGRKQTIIVGTLSLLIGVLLYTLANNLTLLLLGSVFFGLSTSLFSGNNEALIYESLKDKNQTKEFHSVNGKIRSLKFLAFSISGALFALPIVFFKLISPQVTILNTTYSESIFDINNSSPFFLLSSIAILAALIATLFIKEPKSKTREVSTNVFKDLKKAIKIFRTNDKLRNLAIVDILSKGLSESVYQFRNNYFVTLWPVWALGLMSLITDLFSSIGFRISKAIENKIKPKSVFMSTTVLGRVINIIAGLFPSPIMPALVGSTGALWAVREGSKDAIYQDGFSDQQRATMASLIGFAGSVLFSIGAIAVGFIADISSPRWLYFWFQILMLPTIIFYIKAFKKK